MPRLYQIVQLGILAGALSAWPAMAQTSGTNPQSQTAPVTGYATATGATGTTGYTGVTGVTGTTGDYNTNRGHGGGSFGWIGLVGLLGLWGLFRPSRRVDTLGPADRVPPRG